MSSSGHSYNASMGPLLAQRTRVAFTATEEPGFYHVAAVGPAGTRPSADFVVNLDPRGSDVRPVDKSAVPETEEAGEALIGARPKRRVELWHGLAAAVLLFLFGEAVLTRRG